MSAGKYDKLLVEQGALFEMVLTIKDPLGVLINLTGYTFEGMIRKATDDVTPFLTFQFQILNQTTNTGQVRVFIPTADTAAIAISGPTIGVRAVVKYLYDIYYSIGGEKYRVLEGAVKISAEATK